MPMNITELAQLYAPMVAIIALAFWVGGLSNRVKTLEREQKDRKEADRDDAHDHDRIVAMGTILIRVEEKLSAMERELSGVQRALGNIVSGRGNKVVRLQDEG